MASPKKSLIEIMLHFWDPVWLRAWAAPYHDQKGWKAFGVRQMEVFILTARSVVQEEISLRAAALTYRTLLSIVPLLAVGFALFKAFGGLKKFEAPLREVIIENMAVGRGQEVGHWLEKFISNINAGAIAGVGVLVLIYSAVGLLTNIEGSFNKIWGIERGRSLVDALLHLLGPDHALPGADRPVGLADGAAAELGLRHRRGQLAALGPGPGACLAGHGALHLPGLCAGLPDRAQHARPPARGAAGGDRGRAALEPLQGGVHQRLGRLDQVQRGLRRPGGAAAADDLDLHLAG